MFKQARQNRTFEDIISQIQESILQGELKPGDRLPSERNLRDIFKVSRGTLREALRALEQKKLIHIKTGVSGGAFVSKVGTLQISESLDFLLKYQKISLEELAEFREAMEGLVAAKATRKAKKEDLKKLKISLESIREYLDEEELRWDETFKEEGEFHLKLAKIAGNKIFESILFTIYDNFKRYFELSVPKERWILEESYQDLCKILEAMKKRDSQNALRIVQSHIRRFSLVMKKGNKFPGKSIASKNSRQYKKI